MGTPPPQENAVDPALLEIIVCPDCRAGLEVTSQPELEGRADLQPADGELVCGGCGLRYPIRDGIPVLLVDEALPPR